MQHNKPVEPLTIAVVGFGKIGLPLAVHYARHGHTVIGCDINSQVVASINAGISHVHEEAELETEVPRLVQQGLLRATTDTTEAVRNADVVVVIVPVFVNGQHDVDFTTIDAATNAIGAGLQLDTLVVYETTLPVGTTSKRLRALLERASHLNAAQDFYLAYSPERVSSGTIFRDLRTYPKVVGGVDERSTTRVEAFYRSVLEAHILTMASTDEAEFVKLIETTYRDVNIALANEYAQYADTHGLNVATAIAAANTQPYSHIHTPGVGVGGHCIPVYPYFLFANPEDKQTSNEEYLVLPRRARAINDAMAEYAAQRIESIVGSLVQRSVLLLGVAYRGDVKETAFTSAKLLQAALLQHGAQVYVDDPLFSDDELRKLGYTPLAKEQEREVEVIVLQAAHQDYSTLDFGRFIQCTLVLDGRSALNRTAIETHGTRYVTIGDGNISKTTVKIPMFTGTAGAAKETL